MTGNNSREAKDPPAPKSQTIPAAIGAGASVLGAIAAAAAALGLEALPVTAIVMGLGAAISGIVARRAMRKGDGDGD
jgi:hypothetical protein